MWHGLSRPPARPPARPPLGLSLTKPESRVEQPRAAAFPSPSRLLLTGPPLSSHTGLVSECPGQVQTQPFTAGKHGRGQDVGLRAADRDAVGARLRAVQRLAQPLQHSYHPHRLD